MMTLFLAVHNWLWPWNKKYPFLAFILTGMVLGDSFALAVYLLIRVAFFFFGL